MTAIATPARPQFAVDSAHAELLRIPLAELHESPLNPRTTYHMPALLELKDSLLFSTP